MLRRSFTAVLEKGSTFRSGFETEPYEAGWAREARWFVRVLHGRGRGALRVTPEISPDGLHWCEEGTAPVAAEEGELVSLALGNFGSWLRLRCAMENGLREVRVLIYLALKE